MKKKWKDQRPHLVFNFSLDFDMFSKAWKKNHSENIRKIFAEIVSFPNEFSKAFGHTSNFKVKRDSSKVFLIFFDVSAFANIKMSTFFMEFLRVHAKVSARHPKVTTAQFCNFTTWDEITAIFGNRQAKVFKSQKAYEQNIRNWNFWEFSRASGILEFQIFENHISRGTSGNLFASARAKAGTLQKFSGLEFIKTYVGARI